jgi:hypothetical protein
VSGGYDGKRQTSRCFDGGNRKVGKTRVERANGSEEFVDRTEAVDIEITERRVIEETLALGNEVLIGQTVLEGLELLVDCVNWRVIGDRRISLS